MAARRGNYDLAAQRLQQSRVLSESVADHLGVAASWANIGVLERMRGRGDAAEAALLRALAIARERDVPWQQSLFLANLVQLKVAQGMHREALRLGEQALHQLQPPAPRDVRAERVLLLELAGARNALGQSAIAQAYAKRALALATEVGDQVMQAIARAALAQVAAATQQPDALALFAAALRDCEQTGQIPRVIYLSAGLARLQRQAGDAAAAQATARHAQELADAARNPSLQAYAAAAQAEAAAALGAIDPALTRLADARLQALGAGDRIGAGHLARERARLGLELGRLDAAGAALLELDAENDTAGDALALAERWRRARGDQAAAAALQARRLELDAQLPAEQRFGAGEAAGL
ncbi:tetratricopeptide repeat protein [Tahibacter sp. P2K]|uniref:Tetratricopeptide repeat protein n=1 Tax=Tahibacter harae TaxID=2963937 RepID=A0ABT1QYW3_9GAMM|nr:tetratricopeptide repeat protein [Tahibacter harae]